MAIGEGVRKVYEEILTPAGMGDVAIFTEMGRFMMGPYGALVTQAVHEKHIYKEYIGVDACAANLMRPAMYGSYHHLTVLGKEDAPCTETYDVVGLCVRIMISLLLTENFQRLIWVIIYIFMMRVHMDLLWDITIMAAFVLQSYC